ncbi:hypothetical protein FT643_21465 [Ketobacter sp. MCCC 1A13808]|uniref:hypothetical protein n=1 Tax=Ketobacter sp. MCCC 1A13808 TaxID=2602738 RepID=UPI000F24CD48|nr:hypothetical protein [Ketobacter sp. MCCC 1A13808]MVF14711.1 hypothetical protein [Ketobacter sp. MCCC 1A13808]RLP55905.1 MAG: hypothetical protein D6160_00390 [Ketobacter sp.]
MFTMNKDMATAYSHLELNGRVLDRELLKIGESGFSEKYGCVFIKACINIETNASVDDFPDKTGFECFINSINIDDYVEADYLIQGVLLTRKIFSHWNKEKRDQNLLAVLSLDELGLKLKFHLQRTGEQLLSDELNDYEESIMVVDSSDSEFNEGVQNSVSA